MRKGEAARQSAIAKAKLSELERLRAENEELREDAERYRWLKAHPVEPYKGWSLFDLVDDRSVYVEYEGDDLDAAIDKMRNK